MPEPGGRADKLGNKFESLWGVCQLLRVLAGEAVSVLPEGLGDDEKGVDFWVRENDGQRVGHQCKRENATRGKWSIADLARERILDNARFQLNRGRECRFVLVSSDPAPVVSDLIERTAHCNNDPEAYARDSVGTSHELREAFNQLGRHLGINLDTQAGRGAIFDFLSRFCVSQFDRGRRGEEETRLWARQCVEGDPDAAASKLAALVIDELGNELYADRIRRCLEQHGLRVRTLSGVPELHQGIERCKERFRSSVLLIADRLITRSQSAEVLNTLLADGGPRVVCVHGKAGEGKSGVLYEVINTLESKGVPSLPVRLDRQVPSGTPDSFGRDACSLPSSPAACLRAVAGGRKGVLILDQLDAIRWTSAHSSEAWEVCEEMIREALIHPNLKVVVACRTFDLNEDPRIKFWKQKHKVAEIKVDELPEADARAIVSQHGGRWDGFSASQKRLLRSPQCLYLWTTLSQAARGSFRNPTELMRAYWGDLRKSRIPGLSVQPDECDSLLEQLVSFMDKNGRLAAPESLISGWPRARDALVSLNVISIADRQVCFRHQGYLDHLVAEKVLRTVHGQQKTVADWLRNTDQSLFRRDQLRQILTLLRDEDHGRYIREIRETVRAEETRFHLKHLLLTFLGSADPSSREETDLVLELLRDEEWSNHVVDCVLWNKPAWFSSLNEHGIIREWLDSGNDIRINLAFSMMRVIYPRCGHEIVEHLRERAQEHPELVADVFAFSAPEQEPTDLFAFRLRHMQRVPAAAHIDWKKLSERDPRRCVSLFKATVRGMLRALQRIPAGAQQTDLPGLLDMRWEDVTHITSAARKDSRRAWSSLLAYILARWSLIDSLLQSFYRHHLHDEHFLKHLRHLELPEACLALTNVLEAAGQGLASTGLSFLNGLDSGFERLPVLVQRAAIGAMLGAPVEEADVALRWLCRHPVCLELGRKEGAARWEPARRIIERFSPYCSDIVVRELESTIVAYRDPKLKTDHEWQLECAKKGEVYCNHHGWAQQVLLSATPVSRLSDRARDLLGVFTRKFEQTPPPVPFEGSGGSVTSPIPGEKLPLVSDAQWLRIIQTDWSTRGYRWRQIAEDVVAEASHEQFARGFGNMARRQPLRFVKLALQIPKTANPAYIEEVMRAVRELNPPDPNDTDWRPASAEQIEELLDYVGYTDDRDQAMAYCRLIESRADAEWSPRTLAKVCRYAIDHPDPSPEFTITRSSSGTGAEEDLRTTSINCVRGSAAHAIQALLFSRPGLVPTFKPAIDSLVSDPSPAVHVAATGVCLPILNIDGKLAVSLFLRACSSPDDRILAQFYASRFIAYARRRHGDSLKPLILRMIESEIPRVASNGAGWTTATWLETGEMEDEM